MYNNSSIIDSLSTLQNWNSMTGIILVKAILLYKQNIDTIITVEQVLDLDSNICSIFNILCNWQVF
jgi:hypothetical protein